MSETFQEWYARVEGSDYTVPRNLAEILWVESEQHISAMTQRAEAAEAAVNESQLYNRELMKNVQSLQSRIKASQEQEPVGEVLEFLGDEKFVVRINRPTNIGEVLYATPVIIPPAVAELQRDLTEQKELLKDLRNVLESAKRENADLQRKLAEQQAFISKLWTMDNKDFEGKAGFEELTKLIAEAKSNVPDWKSIIIDRLHSKVGLCMTCGIHRCEHRSNTTLPDTVQIDDVLWCINLDEHFFKEAPQPETDK